MRGSGKNITIKNTIKGTVFLMVCYDVLSVRMLELIFVAYFCSFFVFFLIMFFLRGMRENRPFR